MAPHERGADDEEPVLEAERAGRMGASVARAARAAGLPAADIDLVGRAIVLGMVRRIRTLADDHHPAYLHPGRCALVLLRDVGPVPGEVLAAAAVYESEDPGLRPRAEEIGEVLGARVAALVEGLPLPGEDRLLERLVTLDEGARLAALAERLDQVRHLHLRADLQPRWRASHEEVEAVWAPVAERTHARLGTRFRHWHRAFARRLR